jgi:hypothetical protein
MALTSSGGINGPSGIEGGVERVPFSRSRTSSASWCSLALRGWLAFTSLAGRPRRAAQSVEVGAADVLHLAWLVSENARLRGDAVSEVCAELERLQLEFAYVCSGGEA